MRISLLQRSGLGNQLFQYAAALHFAERYNADLEIVIAPELMDDSYGHPRRFLLSKFMITTPYRNRTAFDRVLFSPRRRYAPLQFIFGAVSHDPRYVGDWGFPTPIVLPARASRLYLGGRFHAYQYPESVEQRLRSELIPCDPARGRNAELLDLIVNCECSISLHIRRGDYTKEWNGANVLPLSYYYMAIAEMLGTHSNSTFFVFSDDILFAREHFSSLERVVFVDHNNEENAVEDLRLMSSCQHHIIANSTFSWWGAWLNPRANKIVIAPNRFPITPQPNAMPPTWRVLSV